LTIHVKELLRCEKVREDAIKDLGREITAVEWAAACGTSSLETFTETMLLGKAAKKQMIQCNQRLVMSVARKYQGRGMDISDLVAEGIVGLIKGVERFDHTRGFKFSTYAHWWIRQAVNRAICEQGRVVRSDAAALSSDINIWLLALCVIIDDNAWSTGHYHCSSCCACHLLCLACTVLLANCRVNAGWLHEAMLPIVLRTLTQSIRGEVHRTMLSSCLPAGVEPAVHTV